MDIMVLDIMVLDTAGYSAPPFTEEECDVCSDSKANKLVWDNQDASGPINVHYI